MAADPNRQSIPTTREYLPEIPGPHRSPPSTGLEYTVSFRTTVEGRTTTQVRYTQQWRIAREHELDCSSDDNDFGVVLESGLTTEQVERLSSSIGAKAGGLSASVGAATEDRWSTTSRRQFTHTAKGVGTKRCERMHLVVWQRWDRVEITRATTGFFGRTRRQETVEEWAAEFTVDRRLTWQQPTCCPEDQRFRGKHSLFQIVFEKGRTFVLGRRDAGLITIAGMDQPVGLGTAVVADQLPVSLPWAGDDDPELTFGLLLPGNLRREQIDAVFDLLLGNQDVDRLWSELRDDDLEPLLPFPKAHTAARSLRRDAEAGRPWTPPSESLILPMLVARSRPAYAEAVSGTPGAVAAAFDAARRAEATTRLAMARVVRGTDRARRTMAERLLFSELSFDETLPAGPVVLAANLSDRIDPWLVATALDRAVYVLGGDPSRWRAPPRLRSLLVAPRFTHVPSDPRQGRAVALLDHARQLIHSGHTVLVFPEGTITDDGVLRKGHTGVARIAGLAGVPVVPVGIVGSRSLGTSRTPLPGPHERVAVRVGRAIAPPAEVDDRGQLRTTTDEVMYALQGLTGFTYVDAYGTLTGTPRPPGKVLDIVDNDAEHLTHTVGDAGAAVVTSSGAHLRRHPRASGEAADL